MRIHKDKTKMKMSKLGFNGIKAEAIFCEAKVIVNNYPDIIGDSLKRLETYGGFYYVGY